MLEDTIRSEGLNSDGCRAPSAGQPVTRAFSPSSSSLLQPATIVTSSVPTSVAGHMMYASPHTVMYASTPALADGGLAVLNAFSQGTSAMQVSHAQAQDTGEALSHAGGKRTVFSRSHAREFSRWTILFVSPPLPSPGAVPQVFLTAPPGTVQIPVSAVQLHPVRQDLHFTSETLIFSMQPACHVTPLMHPNRALAHRGRRVPHLSLLCLNVNDQLAHKIDLTKHKCSSAWKSKAWMNFY